MRAQRRLSCSFPRAEYPAGTVRGRKIQVDQNGARFVPRRDESSPKGAEFARYSQQMGDWLDELQPWNYWFTYTFRQGELSVPAVRRMMARLRDDVRPGRLFWATEAGKVTGRNHTHGLIHFDPHPYLPGPSAEMLFRYGLKNFGRSQVEAFDPEKGGQHYVSKYVTKHAHDWDLWTKQQSRSWSQRS